MLYLDSETDVFIDDYWDPRCILVREKDMPRLLQRAGGLAFMGDDNFAELTDAERDGLTFERVAVNGARFALQVRRDQLEAFAPDTELRVATSYPKVASTALERTGRQFTIDLVVGGSVEAMPYIEELDINAVVDVVSSGTTMGANRLVPLEDNLAMVEIGAVWST